jgi:PIN domain nuclease of toxin-antitoxin system
MPIVKTLRDHKLILDTHVWLALAAGNPILSKNFIKSADQAAKNNRVLISSISVWEVGMLVEKKRIILDKDPLDWVLTAFSDYGFQLIPLSPKIAIESTRLPEHYHADPADRMLMATAREENGVLITYDTKILSYGTAAFLSVHDPRN